MEINKNVFATAKQADNGLMEIKMKIATGMLVLLLLTITSVQANDIPNCEVGFGGGIKVPPHKGCTRVTDGPSFRGGYLVDCKGRKLCKLPKRFRPTPIIGRSKPSKKSSPYQLGRRCIIHQKDGRKTYLINKCSFDLNIKWNDKFCKPTRTEKYPCALSINSNGRERRKHIVHDTKTYKMGNETKTKKTKYETFPDFGPVKSVACKSPSYPYEKSYRRVVCR